MGNHEPIITETFEFGSRKFKFSLFHHQLTWCPQTKRGGEDLSELVSLKIRDIFNVHLVCRTGDENQNRPNSSCCLLPAKENSVWETLIINFAQKKPKSEEYRPKQIRLSHTDSNVLNTWLSLVQTELNALKYRPKNLLFFINPYGGKKKATKVFEKKVKPILELCNIKWTVVNTQRHNHATDTLVSMSYDKLCEYDVVVAIGGDGTMCEVVSGLLLRGLDMTSDLDDAQLSPSPVPVAVIPAGSSNALAYTLHGTGDSATAAIHLVLGGSVPLDVGAIQNHSGGISRFIVGQMSYGHLADTLQTSEKFRWMGPKRYDYAGAKAYFRHATYQGSIDMKISTDDVQNVTTVCGSGNGCDDCLSSKEKVEKKPSEWKRVEGRFLGISGANISCRCAMSPLGIAPFAHLSDGFLDLILIRKVSRLGHLRYLLRTASDSRQTFALPFVERYRVEEFVFTPIQCCEPPVYDSISRGPLIESGSTNSIEACGCDPKNPEKMHSVWNCDGELFLHPWVHVKVHKDLIRIMSRHNANVTESSSYNRPPSPPSQSRPPSETLDRFGSHSAWS